VALVCGPGSLQVSIIAPVRLWTDAIKAGRNDSDVAMACLREASKLLYGARER